MIYNHKTGKHAVNGKVSFQKSKCLPKIESFLLLKFLFNMQVLSKIRNRMYCQKFKFVKIEFLSKVVFLSKIQFLAKIKTFVKQSKVCHKVKVLSKIQIFVKTRNFCQKKNQKSWWQKNVFSDSWIFRKKGFVKIIPI